MGALRPWGSLVAWLAIVLAPGCGDGEGARPDAGPAEDAAPPFEPSEPEAPEPPGAPASPRFAPCPGGWTEGTDPDERGIVTCDPWPEGVPDDCEGATAHFPGEPGCSPIGTDCPDDGWPAGLPAEASVWFVDAAAVPGGVGSRSRPFARLGEALAEAGRGDVVALARGRYEEAADVRTELTIWGACAAETVIEAASGAVVTISVAGGVTLRNVTVAGGDFGVGVVDARDPSSLDAVVIEGARATGVFVGDAHLRVTETLVRGPPDPGITFGLGAALHATVELDRVVFDRPGASGFEAREGSSVTARAVVVRDTAVPEGLLGAGDGIVVNSGASIELSESVVLGTHRNGIRAASGTVIARDTVVQDIREVGGAPPGGRLGDGLYADDGSAVTLERVVIERTHDQALSVVGAGSTLDATDLVVRDTEPSLPDDTPSGFAVVAARGGNAHLTRAALLRGAGAGALVLEAGSILVATDLTVRSIAPIEHPWGSAGTGVEIGAGCRAELHRARLVECARMGVFCSGDGAALVAEDVSILDSGGNAPAEPRTQGLVAYAGADAELSRVRIEGSRGFGLGLDASAVVTGADVAVLGTASSTDGRFGHGISVDGASSLTLDRVLVEGNRAVGVAVINGSDASLQNLTARRTEEASCAADGCAAGGIGVQAGWEGRLDVERFRIAGNALLGAQVVTDGRLALHDGRVEDNPIGANIQVDGYDLRLLEDRVLWQARDRRFDADSMPIPAAPGAEGLGPGGEGEGEGEGEIPLDLELEQIGDPAWEPRGFFQTSIPLDVATYEALSARLADLLAPNHWVDGLGISARAAHEPPYDREWIEALASGGLESGTDFTVADLSPPSFWGLFFVLVPTDAAERGTSPDSADGPILGDAVCPIQMSGDLFHEGELFDPDFDVSQAGMQELGLPFDGFSHMLAFGFSNSAAGPVGPLEGSWEFVVTYIDATGDGWRITSRFEVR